MRIPVVLPAFAFSRFVTETPQLARGLTSLFHEITLNLPGIPEPRLPPAGVLPDLIHTPATFKSHV